MLGRQPSSQQLTCFISTYLKEWNAGVVYPSGIKTTVAAIAQRARILVVTNTHDPQLVPNHLSAMGVAAFVDAVVTSVEVGRRKPHPAIYDAALRRTHAHPQNVVFVGDTIAADVDGPIAAGMAAVWIGSHPLDQAPTIATVAELPGLLDN